MTYEVPKKKISLPGLRNLFKLYRYLKPYRVEYGIGLLFLLGSSIASLAFPKLLGELVDFGHKGDLVHEINRIALLLVGVIVAQSVFSYFRVVLFTQVAEKTLADLRQSTFNHLIRLPMKFFQHRRVGELNSRISSDITLLQDALTTTLAEFIRQLIIIVGGITLLMFTSYKLTLFMLAILPLVMVLVVVFGRYIRKLSKLAQSQVADSNTVVEEALQGFLKYLPELEEALGHGYRKALEATTALERGVQARTEVQDFAGALELCEQAIALDLGSHWTAKRDSLDWAR